MHSVLAIQPQLPQVPEVLPGLEPGLCGEFARELGDDPAALDDTPRVSADPEAVASLVLSASILPPVEWIGKGEAAEQRESVGADAPVPLVIPDVEAAWSLSALLPDPISVSSAAGMLAAAVGEGPVAPSGEGSAAVATPVAGAVTTSYLPMQLVDGAEGGGSSNPVTSSRTVPPLHSGGAEGFTNDARPGGPARPEADYPSQAPAPAGGFLVSEPPSGTLPIHGGSALARGAAFFPDGPDSFLTPVRGTPQPGTWEQSLETEAKDRTTPAGIAPEPADLGIASACGAETTVPEPAGARLLLGTDWLSVPEAGDILKQDLLAEPDRVIAMRRPASFWERHFVGLAPLAMTGLQTSGDALTANDGTPQNAAGHDRASGNSVGPAAQQRTTPGEVFSSFPAYVDRTTKGSALSGPIDPFKLAVPDLESVAAHVAGGAKMRAATASTAASAGDGSALWPDNGPASSASLTASDADADLPATQAGDHPPLALATTGAALPLPAAQGSHALPTSPLPLPQIAGQLTAALNRSVTGETELALSPAELGHVRLRLKPDTANPDRMVVMITFERPETLDLFRRHAGELADALRSAGYAGADIGFGQQGGESPGSDRQKSFAPAAVDGLSRRNGADADLPAPRQSAGASLDLRL